MFSSVLVSASLVALVAANAAYPGAPAGFDPTKVYPHPKNYTAHSTKNQGQHYDRVKNIAERLAPLFKRQPPYGPGSFVNTQPGLSWYNSNFNAGTGGVNPNSYTCFGGNVNSLPAQSQWMNFYAAFDLNQQTGMASVGDSGPEQGAIWNAIVTVSQESFVDARLILAVIMQESTGNVRAPCTAGYNCGLMQANHGSVSYNPNDMQNSINQMVRDGTEGTTQGPGYVQYLNGGSSYAYTNCNLGNPYDAARAYNTGSCSRSGNLHCAQFGTASYVNDIANRLIGWNGNGEPQGQCGFPPVGCT